MKRFVRLAALLLPMGCASVSSPPLLRQEPILAALTVDDLPRHGADTKGRPPIEIAKALLAAFSRHGLHQVYGFVNGRKLSSVPEDGAVLQAWVAAGQPLGNHTYSHLSADKLPVEQFIAEIDANEPLLGELVAKASRPFDPRLFRFPYLHEGDTLSKRDAIRNHLRRKGYRIAQVTVDTYDWAYGDAYARCRERGDDFAAEAIRESLVATAKAALRHAESESRALFGRSIKHVVLMHLGAADADAIEELLTAYDKLGVRWISLDEALADPAYATDPRVTENWTFLNQLHAMRGVRPPPFPFPQQKLLGALCRQPSQPVGFATTTQ